MAVSTVEYKGIQLRAAAFQISEEKGYLCSLVMITTAQAPKKGRTLLLRNCWADSGLFFNGVEAISAAIAGGEELIDGEEQAFLAQQEDRPSAEVLAS